MNRLESWFFNRIVKREVIQGGHKHNITSMYSLIVDAARAQFTEDNKPTLDQFLKECHETSINPH